MLTLKDIRFSYGGPPVLDGVSLSVQSGESVALVGANGAGKTTLARICAGVFLPDSGVLASNGVSAADSPVRYRKSVGYVPEADRRPCGFTVKAFLKFRAGLKGERAGRIRRRVLDTAVLCGIEDLLDEPADTLSRGNARRVALAEAVLARPRNLVLDDPFAGMDAQARAAAAATLAALRPHAAVLFATHDFEAVAAMATHVAVLAGGAIADFFRLSPGMGAKELSERAYARDTAGGAP